MGRVEAGAVRLTDLTKAGGCAAKYSAARLETLLAGFVPVEAENLLVGLAPADDAAVYKLDDERALIFTLDFFPPLVDDPADFGAIAATNALNDVFAMGGSPLLALSIAAFPEELPGRDARRRLRRRRRAGARGRGAARRRPHDPRPGAEVRARRGRHRASVRDLAEERRAGRATRSSSRSRSAPGSSSTASSGASAATKELAGAVEWMRTLNREAADALRPFEPNAVTDVTGFGLLGHAHEMAERSGVELVPRAGALARARRRARGRARRRADGRRSAATASSRRRTSRRATRPTSCSRSATTRRPRAGCSSRFRPIARSRSRRRSPRAGSFSGGSAVSARASGVTLA